VGRIVPFLKERRATFGRGYTLELAGMPNAGKSELMGNIRHLFYVEKAEVYAAVEGAFNLKILLAERTNLVRYNLRTFTYSLHHLLAHDLCLFDLVILERSLFDAYCWFTLLKRRGRIGDAAYKTITDFILLDEFRSRLDLVIDLLVDPDEAERREITARHVSSRSVGTNYATLEELRAVHRDSIRELHGLFRIIQIDTTQRTREEVYRRVVDEILTLIEAESLRGA
jgi:hypothetical protein